jgi:hypothetical protein
VDKASEFAFRPSEEELETGLSFSKLGEFKRKYDFQGKFHCQLCPKKILNTQEELKDHMASKV